MSVYRALPNIVTGLRLIAVPIVVTLLLENEFSAAFWLIVAAGLSDGLDGFLAKKLDAVTPLGTYLDPIADKSLLVGVFVTLTYLGLLPGWIVALVILRDLLIVGGVLLSKFFVELALKVEPILISKLNTFLQILLMMFALGQTAVGVDMPYMVSGLIYLVAATTIVSGTLYLARWTSGRETIDEKAAVEGTGE